MEPTGEPEESSTGLDVNLAGLLTYLLGFVTGIVFLVLEKRSPFVRFHAFQSTITFLVLFVLQWAARIVPVIGPPVGFLIPPVGVILWIILMVKAYQGEWYKLPLIGEIAEERVLLGRGSDPDPPREL